MSTTSDTHLQGKIQTLPSSYSIFSHHPLPHLLKDNLVSNDTPSISNPHCNFSDTWSDTIGDRVHPFHHLYTLSQGSFLDSKDAKNDEDENSASNLILHPSTFIMTRFTTTPHDGLTDKDFIVASDYGPDSIFYNHHKFPSELLQ